VIASRLLSRAEWEAKSRLWGCDRYTERAG